MAVFKAEPRRKKSAKESKSQLTGEFRCNRYPPMSAEILRRFAAEHGVDFHWDSRFLQIQLGDDHQVKEQNEKVDGLVAWKKYEWGREPMYWSSWWQ
jgi:hypothetical protein